MRLPLSTGIVGHVVDTGHLININNVNNHPLWYQGCDQETGFKTRNILCFPISDNNEVIGVAELCNKQSGSHFTKFDEEMAMAFSSYCGLAILHSLMYKKVADAQYRSKLSNELMMYHMKVRKYFNLFTTKIFSYDVSIATRSRFKRGKLVFIVVNCKSSLQCI